MARTSMASLITTLRGFANAGTADFTLGTVGYWSDDQLQTILDRHRFDLREAEIIPEPLYNTGGTVEYKIYQSAARWFESTDSGGSARFVVSDGIGGIFGTANWTADYENGIVNFATDQAGSARFVTGQSYDVFGAASEVWNQKAAAAASAIDFSTDNHSIKRSHVATEYRAMATYYASLAISGPGASSSADILRGDLNYSPFSRRSDND